MLSDEPGLAMGGLVLDDCAGVGPERAVGPELIPPHIPVRAEQGDEEPRNTVGHPLPEPRATKLLAVQARDRPVAALSCPLLGDPRLLQHREVLLKEVAYNRVTVFGGDCGDRRFAGGRVLIGPGSYFLRHQVPQR